MLSKGIRPYKEMHSGYCGPASMHIALKAEGCEISEVALARWSGATVKEGVALSGLVRAAQKAGFKAIVREPSSIREIRRCLKNGYRLIVAWFSVDDSHCSTVAGIDRNNIQIADPETGHIAEIPIKHFEKVWFTYDGSHMTHKGLHTRELVIIIPKI